MTKPKSGGLARLPKEQRCHFFIGPVSSWFMPNTTDIWTQPNPISQADKDTMDCDQIIGDKKEAASLSYFAYGSIGCFCYGEVHHHHHHHHQNQIKSQTNQISASTNRLIDIKDDNSRVSCIRFSKDSPYPLVVALTENGSFLLHDCLTSENLFQFKKNDILTKFLGIVNNDAGKQEPHSAKKTRSITQQVNAFAWPETRNIFLAVSLLTEKTCQLLWLKLKDIIAMRSNPDHIDKNTIVEQCTKINLNLNQYSSPVCLVESTMLDKQTCLVAIAMDDGLITVVSVDFDKGQSSRIIKLARHNDQICSMSLFVGNSTRFQRGLLASVSRNGLALIWDIENEFYFADYQAIAEPARASSSINWFAVTFVPLSDSKQTYLAISNSDSGITLLEVPENTRSKVRLKGPVEKVKRQGGGGGGGEEKIHHDRLIFNMKYDPKTRTIITASLDGNHIFWSVQGQHNDNTKKYQMEAKAVFLYPGMLNNSRTHMLRHSPIREDLLGLALGKAGVRFYKISENSAECRYDMSPSCSLISRRILKTNLSPTSIAWHPSHEYRLAIGTLEGKVFRADITPRKATLVDAEHKPVASRNRAGTKRPPVVEDDLFGVDYQPLERAEEEPAGNGQQKSKTDGVYSLCWGPNPASPEDISKQAIYAIGSVSHRLFIYCNTNNVKDNSTDKLTNYLDEFLDQSLPEAIGQASEVVWKSSMDLMALGTTNGKIIIVTYLEDSHSGRSEGRLFSRLAVIEGPLGPSYIQCLAWHPSSDKDDAHYYYLAASANESPAFLFNVRETILATDVKNRLKLGATVAGGDHYNDETGLHSGNDGTGYGSLVLSAYLHKLEGHQKAITDIAWSPHDTNQLATSSFDRLAYVWSIDSSFMDGQMVSKYWARDRLFTIEWSLVDADLIFTSGHDSTVWAWRPSENRHQVNITQPEKSTVA